MRTNLNFLLGTALAVAMVGAAGATPITRTSPTGGALPASVTEIGGIVLDLQGTNGGRVVSQLAASSLYVGFADDGQPVPFRGNPLTIGVQSGFTPAIVTALGGGLVSASVRITLFDGDTAPGDFDFSGQNFLEIGGQSLGDFSTVATQQTDPSGVTALSTGFGFGNEILSTGFFSSIDATVLAAIFTQISTGTVTFQLRDTDANDNFFDFTRGVDGGLINIGTGPVIQPPVTVPEPMSITLFGMALAGLSLMRLRRKASAA